MSTERKFFTTAVAQFSVKIREPIKGKTNAEDEAYKCNQLVVVRIDNGLIIACIDRDNFYDRTGNRFYYE